MAGLVVLFSEGYKYDCKFIARQLDNLSSDEDAYELLGVHGVWMCLCESLLYRGHVESEPWPYILEMTEKHWHIVEERIQTETLYDTDSEAESNTGSGRSEETADPERGQGKTSFDSSGADSPVYTRSKLRMNLIAIDKAVASGQLDGILPRSSKHVQLGVLLSKAVANQDHFLTRPIQWRRDMLSLKYTRMPLMETDLVPESIYQRVQNAYVDTRGDLGSQKNEASLAERPRVKERNTRPIFARRLYNMPEYLE